MYIAAVTTNLRKDKMNKKGMVPVNFRVVKDQKIYYVTTDTKLTADEWGEKNNRHINARYCPRCQEDPCMCSDID